MTIEFPHHAPLPHFEARDGCLLIGGYPITQLAARIGRTPFYVYDRQVITRRLADLRRALPVGIGLHYAIKANPMPAVVAHVAAQVDGLDVASGGEMKIALDTGMAPDRISIAGPGKTDQELMRAAASGITVNVESEREIDILAAIGRASGTLPRIAIRVNPDFELKTSGMKMGGGPKQFGIDAEQVPKVLKGLAGAPLEFVGFHIFSGSQNLRADAIVDSQQKAMALAVQLARQAPAPVSSLNLGGGFGIPYFPGEQHLDLEPIGANLRELLARARQELPHAHLVLELGRYIVGEAGLYVCKVIDRKISRGHVFLVTDGGLHHHLAASGNFGQVLRKNYPLAVANRMSDTTLETASVVGPLCTPLDLLGDRVTLPRVIPGDLIAVFQSGAYGLSASPMRFLSHAEPAEIFI
jgi:diaminopimelate decarboxylase